MANRLRRYYSRTEAEITVVDRDDAHVYQPGLLFVPFGLSHAEDIVRSRQRQLRQGVGFHQSDVDHVGLDDQRVTLTDGTVLPYDALIVATGARLQPEETEGMTGDGWLENVFTFYDVEGAMGLHSASGQQPTLRAEVAERLDNWTDQVDELLPGCGGFSSVAVAANGSSTRN